MDLDSAVAADVVSSWKAAPKEAERRFTVKADKELIDDGGAPQPVNGLRRLGRQSGRSLVTERLPLRGHYDLHILRRVHDGLHEVAGE